ncbi:MAG: polyhydroxyalkanoate synthesis repressor PhaR [Steroidobacteraceae bacterium]
MPTPTPRLIKKYPNRRLYDTGASRYVTLNDVYQLVIEKTEFAVLDARSGKDITRSILLQLIAEQEQRGAAMMSEEFLSQLVRAYGGPLQGLVGTYLQQCLRLLMAQQQPLQDRMRSMVGVDPVATTGSLAERSLEIWREHAGGQTATGSEPER